MISKKELNRLFKDVSCYRKEEFIDILMDLADYLKKADEERKKQLINLRNLIKMKESKNWRKSFMKRSKETIMCGHSQ